MDIPTISNIFKLLDRELWVVTAADGSRRGGLVATSLAAASIAPELPRIRISLAHRQHTCELVKASGAFAAHLITDDQLDLVWRFALQHGHDRDKLAGLDVRASEQTGSPLLAGALAWLDCRVEATLDAGDRMVFLAEVLDGRLTREGQPLTQNRLLAIAPEDKRAALRADMEHDARLDVEAVRRWRAARGEKR
ncbi:MAG TPA: flavin reductase family protein [Planctomycetaceae bacterium]|nr:flavin reductase family protein [Planctomycetaceae bacterium]